MPHMIATKVFTYAGGSLQLKPGDKFFALSDRDAKWLKVWGKAEEVASMSEYLRKDETAEESDEPVKRGRGRPRKYDRRDMTADK